MLIKILNEKNNENIYDLSYYRYNIKRMKEKITYNFIQKDFI